MPHDDATYAGLAARASLKNGRAVQGRSVSTQQAPPRKVFHAGLVGRKAERAPVQRAMTRSR